MLNIGVLTVSDKGSRGERQDESGKVIQQKLTELDCRVVNYEIVPDEREIIADKLSRWVDVGNIDVIFTTGGTGLSPRDVTPEATLSVVDRVVPGIGEAMRMETFRIAPTAILSRAVAGVRKSCLIINLPGSRKAVEECLAVILPVIPHAVEMIKGEVTEHNTPDH